MFDFLFGWRKASKCKKLIKQVQCRLKLLKNKKSVISKQLREDVMQLIKNGYQQTAFNRVEQIVEDETKMAAYEILGNFCEFILQNLSYIRKHKECPNDVNEAVSSLIFASARCGDLPELQLIRKLFGERYGRRFETAAVELSPGNLVNRQIKEKLSANSVSQDDKHRMINEIARDCLQPQLLALEYRSDWHQKRQVELPIKQTVNYDERKRAEALLLLHVDSWRSTSCETLPQFPEERIVYVDDVVELCSSTTTEGDQRLFKFKTPAAFPKGDYNSRDSSNQIHADPSESWSEIENSSSKRTSLSRRMQKTEHNIEKGNNNHEISQQKQRKTEILVSEGATDKEMEWASFYKKPRRRRRRRIRREPPPPPPPPPPRPSSDLKSAAYDVFTYPGYGSNTETKKLKEATKSITVENGDKKNVSSYPVGNKKEALYLRATTFPPERPKQSPKASFPRTNSCPYKQPSHVHPKLPDYDDIAAKFMALKREHLQKNTARP